MCCKHSYQARYHADLHTCGIEGGLVVFKRLEGGSLKG